MKEILKEKKIEHLIHFTNAENLFNIFRYGLIPRTELVKRDIESAFNLRSRKYHDAVALTIEFPDYTQFNAIRFRQHNLPWVILKIDASKINYNACAYSPLKGSELRYGQEGFLSLFDEVDDQKSRAEMELDACYPTTVQSKVLCYETIPVDAIKEVHFPDADNYWIYKGTIPKKSKAQVKVDRSYFRTRHDFEFWKVNNYKPLPQ
ncbi:hypothetical protein A4S06_03310 [Erysipelotrichaceae bacterium MTC7]|nr:hypothetical protein A4S06_03310 [Erysipelotrichaceae bacterium MTC7]